VHECQAIGAVTSCARKTPERDWCLLATYYTHPGRVRYGIWFFHGGDFSDCDMLCYNIVLKAETNVSEEHAASIFRVLMTSIVRCDNEEDRSLNRYSVYFMRYILDENYL
jgi:hypothetical protein